MIFSLILFCNSIIAQENSLEFNICGPNNGGEITFIGSNEVSIINSLKVAKWQDAFSGTPSNLVLNPEFYNSDVDRFYIRIEDETQVNAGMISAHMKAYDINGEKSDDIMDFILIAQSPGIFQSEACILVSNKVDNSISPNTINIFNVGKIAGAEATPNTPAIEADPLDIKVVGTVVVVEYDSNEGKGPLEGSENFSSNGVGVCEGMTNTVDVRGIILNKPNVEPAAPFVKVEELKETIASMNIGWAQCCVEINLIGDNVQIVDQLLPEVFFDDGYDHDGNPNNDPIGANNGMFDFSDNGLDGIPMNNDPGDNDGIHNFGEKSETFIDSENPFGIKNESYDFGIDLTDGLGNTPTVVSNLPREIKTLFDYYGDNSDETIEVYVINHITDATGTRGRSYPANVPLQFMPNPDPSEPDLTVAFASDLLETPNQILFNRFFVGALDIPGGALRDFSVAPHELGHIIMQPNNNLGHLDGLTIIEAINFMVEFPNPIDDNDVTKSQKRFNSSQEESAQSF